MKQKMKHTVSFMNLVFYLEECAKKIGRVAIRPILLTYFVIMDEKTPTDDKIALATSIMYLILHIDLISAKRFPVIGWMDEIISLSVAYKKVQSHITTDIERQANELLDKWFPEYTYFETVE